MPPPKGVAPRPGGCIVKAVKQVLFVCTGNYYRSRLAEALFNYEAERSDLPWRAFSRGLATWLVPEHSLSPNTVDALRERRIPQSYAAKGPTQLSSDDLARASRTIALKESEHRPMFEHDFPDWASEIEYWHVHDVDVAHPDEAVPEVAVRVRALLEELESQEQQRATT